MKRLVPALLICAAGPALAGPETLLTCAQGQKSDTGWSVLGASTVCHQSVAGSGLDSAVFRSRGEKRAAFQNNILLAIRPAREADAIPSATLQYKPEAWTDTGSTGVLGELWWGKTGERHVFIGQESALRLGNLAGLSPALVPALQDYSMRLMMATLQKRPVAYKPGDENFMLFQKKVINYTQFATTTVDFRGGYGGYVAGPDYIPSAKVTNARLELQTRPVIKGVLKFDLVVDGQNRHFEMPLQAETEQEPLRARVSGDDGALPCSGQEDALSFHTKTTCLVPNGVPMGADGKIKEFYDAIGAFFGDHASLVALHFKVTVNSPSRNRSGATGRGVLILKAD